VLGLAASDECGPVERVAAVGADQRLIAHDRVDEFGHSLQLGVEWPDQDRDLGAGSGVARRSADPFRYRLACLRLKRFEGASRVNPSSGLPAMAAGIPCTASHSCSGECWRYRSQGAGTFCQAPAQLGLAVQS